MKTILVTLTFLLSFLTFSQKLIIHVFERQEMVSFSKTAIDSVLLNPDIVMDKNTDYTKYVIDLNQETSTYFLNNEELSTLPIKCQNLGNGILKINIMEEGFDYGLLVQTDYQNESVTWFWFTEYATTVKNITKFKFEKPS
jgi:hypothetical protein